MDITELGEEVAHFWSEDYVRAVCERMEQKVWPSGEVGSAPARARPCGRH